jgi:hypothetical protein
MEEMMSNSEWEKVKEALRKPATPEAMREAAQAYAQYNKVSLGKGSSTPTLVNLGKGTGYPHAVPVDKIPDELATNPQFFELMQKIVAKEKS